MKQLTGNTNRYGEFKKDLDKEGLILSSTEQEFLESYLDSFSRVDSYNNLIKKIKCFAEKIKLDNSEKTRVIMQNLAKRKDYKNIMCSNIPDVKEKLEKEFKYVEFAYASWIMIMCLDSKNDCYIYLVKPEKTLCC